MIFYKKSRQIAEANIAKSLGAALLKFSRVLWLVSGGSNIQTQKNIMDILKNSGLYDLTRLVIFPMDERFGPARHSNSNHQQMVNAGFNPGLAVWHDVLIDNLPLEATLDKYNRLSDLLFEQSQYIVGTFGLGVDGHTAGILPNSPATYDSGESACAYTGDDYIRLTLLPRRLIGCSEAYVLSYGEDKQQALENLQQNVLDYQQMPSKIFYEFPSVSVYNDYIESEV